MNKTDAFFHRQVIKQPFATGGASTPLTPIGNSSSSPINVFDGFTAAYTAAGSTGRFVTRGDMNAIGNLASQSQFYFQAGGLNTFDQAFAATINGYPKDAVLDYLVGTRLYKVVSLHDNNKVDFTGAVATETGITSGRVDGVNWAYANVDMPTVDRIEAGSIPQQLPPGTATMIMSFIAPANGMVFVDGSYTINPNNWNPTGELTSWVGAGLFIKEKGDSDIGSPLPVRGYSGWTPFYAFTRWWYGDEQTTNPIFVQTFDVEAGHKYCVASACGHAGEGATVTNTPVVQNIDMKVYIV